MTRTALPRTSPWDPANGHRFVTSDGTALHVVDSGPADAELTVVLLHGWTLDHTSWDRVVEGIPAGVGAAVRVLRFDLRGHGGSAPAPRGTATIGQLADDLAELVESRVPSGRLVLVGHSMGGMTIMALAERHPELVLRRVAGVGLVATSSGDLANLTLGLPRSVAAVVLRGERLVNRRLAKLRRPMLLRRTDAVRPGLRWLLFGRRPDRADVVATAEQVGRCHPPSMVAFRDSLIEHERRLALAGLRDRPCVVFAGGADRLCPVPHARVIAGELPDADLVVYPGAGHMLPVERSVEITTRLSGLVRGLLRVR
ncbi:alpha/beta hydrolase [Solihabitans fulvus]|uniref:Alpha/beta hydrolase n=1 Tax=Solihabitans fulvus TaxID=1892852 RepID=A0A5B2XMR8_9PSEU|nr:alpha/beta hydrolase [Solihabitans fulvus]KAA2264092.1 alpha/beta hydrolase [Solihabitans fulvus]